MTSRYSFHLGAAPAVSVDGRAAGSGAIVEDFPLLSGISAAALTLPCGAVEGPRWYTNAGLLAYCTQGAALVTVLSPANLHDVFTVDADELFFVEQGFAYSIANASAGPTHLIALLSHERPVACAPADLIAAPPSFIRSSVRGAAVAPRVSSPHKLAMREVRPSACAGGATTRVVTGEELSILDRLALCTLAVLPSGAAEPHWHPNCGELGYVLGGRARLSVVSPQGGIERLELGLGDLYFVPPAYPHWQETLGEDELRILIGFTHQEPLTIALGNAVVAFPMAGRNCRSGG